MINRLNENRDVVVTICCITYNHEKYIRDALDSFLMQKTNFPIEVLIHDDASTDNTANIIREYEKAHSDIIKPICQKENQYSKGVGISITYQFPRARGKYIAMCEGDDYWTDPLKLQKQVDFLEGNLAYNICGTKWLIKDKLKENLRESPETINGNIFTYIDVLYGRAAFRTCTLVFRKEMLANMKVMPDVINGDKILVLHLLKNGYKGYNLTDFTAVYRIHPGGIWTHGSKIKILLSYYLLFSKYSHEIPDEYNKDVKHLRKLFAMRIMAVYLRQINITEALRYLRYLSLNKILIKEFLNELGFTQGFWSRSSKKIKNSL